MSTQPQQPQPQPAQMNSTSPSISNPMSNPSNASASDGVELVRKSEPGSIVDQSNVDQSNEVQSTEVRSNEVQVPSTGANTHATTTDPTTTNANPNPEVPFKERVIGVAKKTRGTPEVKEHGERILQGSASVFDATGRSV
ncbi:hypothetical protein HHX47_DHR4000872 [Lentinula edodes]|nr:hypothetical protein HHX47_DHR4000872 [Lentinula edodes]